MTQITRRDPIFLKATPVFSVCKLMFLLLGVFGSTAATATEQSNVDPVAYLENLEDEFIEYLLSDTDVIVFGGFRGNARPSNESQKGDYYELIDVKETLKNKHPWFPLEIKELRVYYDDIYLKARKNREHFLKIYSTESSIEACTEYTRRREVPVESIGESCEALLDQAEVDTNTSSGELVKTIGFLFSKGWTFDNDKDQEYVFFLKYHDDYRTVLFRTPQHVIPLAVESAKAQEVLNRINRLLVDMSAS